MKRREPGKGWGIFTVGGEFEPVFGPKDFTQDINGFNGVIYLISLRQILLDFPMVKFRYSAMARETATDARMQASSIVRQEPSKCAIPPQP